MSFLTFRSYSLISVMTAATMVVHAVQKQDGSFFNTVVYLTSQKINLLVFFNFIIIVLVNAASLLIWIFFDQIRSIESKYIMDKSQKKIFHFLLLTLILRSTFDIYKFLSLAVLFGFWIIHWLVYKRSDYLVSRGSRGVKDHLRLLILYVILIGIDFIVTYAFYERFQTTGEKMNEIYVIIGFEFVRLLLKAIQDNFKYTISLFELYHREQWTEKGFVFNIVSFFFDFIVLLLNIKLFTYILSRQQFPLYLLGEIIDTFVRLGKSIQLFIQSRSLIGKLKKLPDVNAPQDLLPGVDSTCIICLEEIKQAKRLKCGHIFHLNCLRRWLEQNVQCPTCRDKIELDSTATQTILGERGGANLDREIRLQNAARRRVARLNARRDHHLPLPQEGAPPPDAQVPGQQPGVGNEFESPDVNREELKRDDSKIREARLNRLKYKRHNDDILDSEQKLDELVNQFIEAANRQGSNDIFNVENSPRIEEEEKKAVVDDVTPLLEEIKSSFEFKDIFQVDEEELFQLLDAKPLSKPERSNQPGALKSEQFINKALFEDQPITQSRQSQPFDLRFGSVPFGLPCVAMTRRTLDMTLKNKQIEMINEKISRIMRLPSEYVTVNEGANIPPPQL